jgi:hypothetical protein
MPLLALFAGLFLSTAAPAPAESPPENQLDFLAGEWAITGPGGVTGRSHIVAQLPGAMLFELRDIEGEGPLPLWFERSERTHGWIQLFPAPGGIREFTLLSPQGEWPMVFGAEVTLRDGGHARFRLTMSRTSVDENRRLLEISRDGGSAWATVFDYHYRRLPSPRH